MLNTYKYRNMQSHLASQSEKIEELEARLESMIRRLQMVIEWMGDERVMLMFRHSMICRRWTNTIAKRMYSGKLLRIDSNGVELKWNQLKLCVVDMFEDYE